ncbi:IS200/IS605 family accessory protein TnpB-related protein [Niallia sp. Krafla_26]|uniref:IS200/IS605 family accessory protein TnpB-related protein n=1 Tax=Niallia sp. Krafla_26 TaxID=3064703 RepID=UPI003D16E229
MLQTYQTKLRSVLLNNGLCPEDYLQEFGKFFGILERKLFVQLYVKKQTVSSIKSSFSKQHGITARQFNSLRIQLEGKIDSVKENTNFRMEQLTVKIAEVEKSIDKKHKQKETWLEKIQNLSPTNPRFENTVKRYQNIKFVLHQKKRKLRNLQQKREKLTCDIEVNRVRICFGSKKLFHKQFHLEENGYTSHEEWKHEWQCARSAQFLVVGSKDETFGNQSASYNTKNELRLRVARYFEEKYGKYICIPDVLFPYGQPFLDEAKKAYTGITKGGKTQKYFKAVTYRFVRKKKGWYLYATVDRDTSEIETSNLGGAIGIDLNAGFLTACEIDRFGNPLREWKISCPMYDRRKEQVSASLSDAIQSVLLYAKENGKQVVIENLNFSKKRVALGEKNKKYARMLSGFAYAQFQELIQSKAKKLGVGIVLIHPAYTSQIGHMKFMARYGLSSHGSAACMIARKSFRFRTEQPRYDTVLGLPKTFDKEKSNYRKWMSLTQYIKRNYAFQDKIELLKADR